MNGSISSIKKIIDDLNSAQLDGKTGKSYTSSSQTYSFPTWSSPANAPLEVVVAPPALYLLQVQSELKPPARVSAQNAFSESSGAFTGEISPNQLKDANVHWVILGHSERRALFGDSDKLVADKVKAAVGAGLSVIACIGETLEQRENGTTKEVVEKQLEAIRGQIKEEDWS